MRASEIFNPGGYPRFSYYSRTQFDLEKKIKESLQDSHKFISLTGPTKSGKTVLCQKIIPEDKGIWIDGSDIHQEVDFWNEINRRLEEYTGISSGRTNGKKRDFSSKMRGGVSVAISNFDGEVQGTESTEEGTTRTLSRVDDPKQVALDALRIQIKPIIIDEFHYIPHHAQVNIVRSLKKLIYRGLGVMLISVPHKAYDAQKIQSDMEGRIQNIVIPPWQKNELKGIAEIGFKNMNVIPDDEIFQKLANESLGNPQIMQELCKALCDINSIKETLAFRKKITMAESPKEFFQMVSHAITSPLDFELLLKESHSVRNQRIIEFSDGTKGDMYTALIKSMANTGPKDVIPYDELTNQLSYVTFGKVPALDQISEMLLNMQKATSHSEGRARVFEWDKNTHKIYMLNPYFSFYLRWKVRDQYLTAT